jgi:hypothetical protein
VRRDRRREIRLDAGWNIVERSSGAAVLRCGGRGTRVMESEVRLSIPQPNLNSARWTVFSGPFSAEVCRYSQDGHYMRRFTGNSTSTKTLFLGWVVEFRLKFPEYFLPGAWWQETYTILSHEGTFLLGTIVLAYVWIGVPTTQSLKLSIELGQRASLIAHQANLPIIHREFYSTFYRSRTPYASLANRPFNACCQTWA